MDVVGLAFAVFGHLLASVLYIWRRIPFSSSSGDAVDRSSILENKDQLRQLWETRMMADEQPQTQAPHPTMEEPKEIQEKQIVPENCSSPGCPPPEECDKGHSETHDIAAIDDTVSTDHGDISALPVSESADVLTNEPELSTEKDQIPETVHLPEHQGSEEEKHDQKDISEEQKISEKTEGVSCDAVQSEEHGNSLSDDQKAASKICDEDRNEDVYVEEGGINEQTELGQSEKCNLEDETSTEELPMRSVEATLVPDVSDTEQFDEPTTEAYYTSNFTFVCQKTCEKTEEKEEIEEHDDASDKMEFVEAQTVEQSEEMFEKEIAQPVEAFNTDGESVFVPSEVSDSSFGETSLPEFSENAEAAAETGHDNQVPCESTMTNDFLETDDKALNEEESQLVVNEKSERESEIDADENNKLNNNAASEENDRTESAPPDSDGELKTEQIERPTHFIRLKKTGVRKTERPYDSGTTESKIAMEIREMREREEELRLMRERLQSPEGDMSSSSSPLLSPTSSKQKPSNEFIGSPESGPGYRVSTVFGHKGSPVPTPVEEEKKTYRSFSKESSVEKEIRIARNREEELRKEKGLPPREDDSYIKPSQVKSAQVRVFGKVNAPSTSKELATTKIQQEIEEQTLREMALREKGHIQTISQERTDSKVAKLKDLDLSVPECTEPTSPNGHGPFSDRTSKRSTPSPTGSSHGSISPVSPRPVGGQGKGISMQKFIASKGKETTFIASRNGLSHPEQNADASRSNPGMRKIKRTVSVESKIQQEILEMKLREEELRRMHHPPADQPFLTSSENGTDFGVTTNDASDYVNGQATNGSDESGPPRNNLIAQWEQRIQKAEGRA